MGKPCEDFEWCQGWPPPVPRTHTALCKKHSGQLRVLDLCSGLGGWGEAFLAAGHSVVTLDNNPKFKPTILRDILTVHDLREIEQDRKYDVVVASPPCECFSVASLGHHWTGGKEAYIPATKQTMLNLRIAWQVFYLIAKYNPKVWVIENPQGVLKKLSPIPHTCTVWYCRFGETRAKPTNLWTNILTDWTPYECHNGNPDHEAAPRGAKTGTQGIRGAALRGKIPYGLSDFVRQQAESMVVSNAYIAP